MAGPLGGQVGYLRVDAGSEWLDPHPITDQERGPRLRIEAGQSCPASDPGIVGVRNSGPRFDTALAPAEAATGGRICRYDGGNRRPFALLSQRQLSAAQAARLAGRAAAMDLSHSNTGPHSCPMDDGAAAVLVLEYENRPAADLWVKANGCQSVSNGTISALGGLKEVG